MNSENANLALLADELLALPSRERLARLRAEGSAPDELIVALADECERRTFARVTAGLEAADLLATLADEVGEPRGRARARRVRAHALAYAGRMEESLEQGRAAITIGEAAGDQVEVARARLASMHPLGELGRYDEALAAGSAARKAFLAADEPALAAYADVNLGIIHQNRDAPSRALEHFDRARHALQNEPIRLAWIENNRGEALKLLHDFDGAEAAYRAALDVSERVKSGLTATISEGNLAELAAWRGQLQPAMFHFERARRRFERDEAGSHLARLIAEQAEAMESLGLSEEAVGVFRDALVQLERHGLAAEAARARQGMGRALLRLGRIAEADIALAGAAQAFEQLGNPTAKAKVDMIRAEVALAQGQPQIARFLLLDAEATLADRPADLAALRHGLARIALAEGDLGVAEEQLAAALPIAVEIELSSLRADLLHTRARLRRRQNRLPEAIEDLRTAVAEVERLRGTLQADRFRTAYLGNRRTLYEDLVTALLDQPTPAVADAFATIEQAKSRALLDAVSGMLDAVPTALGEADDPADAELRRKAAATRGELNALYSQLMKQSSLGRERLSLGVWREALRLREAELAALERRLATTRDRGGAFAAPSPLAQVQAQIDDNSAVVEYYIAGDELLAIVIDRDHVRVFRNLARASDVENQAQRVLFQLGRAARPGAENGLLAERLLADVRRELGTLWRSAIGPMADALRAFSRLTLVPDGPLHVVPLHALWDGQQHLIESHEISYAPSASLFAHLAQRADAVANDGPALVVGVADAVAPRIADEAAEIAEALPGATRLIGDAATVDAVSRAAGAARVIHLACHGWYSSQSPLSSGLRLADRWLTVRDVYALRLRADLVTLSGCETGRSLVQAGDELLGFLRGFIAAGARSLIVSQWVVNDHAAAEMMRAFYRLWYRAAPGGPTKAAVMRQVQCEALLRRPHPTFWAPFIVVGNP